MILLAHMLFGAAIGSLIQNPPIAVVLAFLGHYFLDLFPHIEYLEDGVEYSIKKLQGAPGLKGARNIAKVFLDFSLALLLIFLFSKNQPIIYFCALVAIVPDGLTIIHSLFPNLGLELHHRIHGGPIHYLTKQKKFPVVWRIATQVVAVAVSIIILQR